MADLCYVVNLSNCALGPLPPPPPPRPPRPPPPPPLPPPRRFYRLPK